METVILREFNNLFIDDDNKEKMKVKLLAREYIASKSDIKIDDPILWCFLLELSEL